jgi:TetR/AcrR family transcriptional regulator, transcriptional repressor for nem operon
MHTLTLDRPARDVARMIIGGLEGAMLIARPYGDAGRFQTTAATLLASLTPAQASQA